MTDYTAFYYLYASFTNTLLLLLTMALILRILRDAPGTINLIGHTQRGETYD